MTQVTTMLIFQDDPAMLTETVAEFERQGMAPTGTADEAGLLSALEKGPFNAVLFNWSTLGEHEIQLVRSVITHRSLVGASAFVAGDVPYCGPLDSLIGVDHLKVLSRPMALGDMVRAIKSHVDSNRSAVDYTLGIYQATQESLQEVIEFYIQGQVEKHGPNWKLDSTIDALVSSVMNVSGPDYIGSVLINFNRELIMRLAEAMMGVDPAAPPEVAMLVDIAGEVCNQMSSVLAHKLEGLGMPTAIGLPRPFVAGRIHYVHPGANRVGVIAFGQASPPEQPSSVEICFDKVA